MSNNNILRNSLICQECKREFLYDDLSELQFMLNNPEELNLEPCCKITLSKMFSKSQILFSKSQKGKKGIQKQQGITYPLVFRINEQEKQELLGKRKIMKNIEQIKTDFNDFTESIDEKDVTCYHAVVENFLDQFDMTSIDFNYAGYVENNKNYIRNQLLSIAREKYQHLNLACY